MVRRSPKPWSNTNSGGIRESIQPKTMARGDCFFDTSWRRAAVWLGHCALPVWKRRLPASRSCNVLLLVEGTVGVGTVSALWANTPDSPTAIIPAIVAAEIPVVARKPRRDVSLEIIIGKPLSLIEQYPYPGY